MRVLGADSGRQQHDAILQQPRGHFHGARGMPEVSHVRHAIRGRPEMPQMQEHCSAGLPP